MKRLHIIILAITLLISQWGTIDHVYHEHTAGEVCDYCIGGQPLDNAISSSFQSVPLVKQTLKPLVLAQESISKSVTRFYSVRAPPRFI